MTMKCLVISRQNQVIHHEAPPPHAQPGIIRRASNPRRFCVILRIDQLWCISRTEKFAPHCTCVRLLVGQISVLCILRIVDVFLFFAEHVDDAVVDVWICAPPGSRKRLISAVFPLICFSRYVCVLVQTQTD
jgi:hypothetical protein